MSETDGQDDAVGPKAERLEAEPVEEEQDSGASRVDALGRAALSSSANRSRTTAAGAASRHLGDAGNRLLNGRP